MCLELEISSEVLDQIDEGFQAWAEDYERCVINYINPFVIQLVIDFIMGISLTDFPHAR